ncbi:hypothetical protein J132_08553 [Termitomyces sp. J132]|nr:hypothetical protein H2248_006242 [Termitomyces sp. 'cryptogamus']KNZ79895.1 hypothetical protein J132_08553 [Termitomyces sp. J132]
MVKVSRFSLSFAALFSFILIPALAAATARSRYSEAHSLGKDYEFDPRDGWQTIKATDLSYKYPRNSTSVNKGLTEKRNAISKLGAIGDIASHVWKGMKGIGKLEKVTITWYTGHDLKNPSCWAQGGWSPTDKSFACATTLHGWHDRPKCFEFLEVCNGPKKCVFVRVVDSCAGCKEGSHHIDLTRAAFCQLADPDTGKLTVQYRPATPPADCDWREELWGPRHNNGK